jgi:hypothetical protein
MSAIDELGMSAMLDHPVTITAAEPDSGRLVTVEVDRDRARWRPSTAVVFAGATETNAAPRSAAHVRRSSSYAFRSASATWLSQVSFRCGA